MCYSPSEAQADEYEAVRDILCDKCLKLFDEKDGLNTPYDEYDFCDICKNNINKYYTDKYNEENY